MILAWLVLFGACQKNREGANPSPEEVRHFAARGVLREVTSGGRRARISHEAISGYMGAMTMEFDLGEGVDTAALHPGEAIAFRLCVTDRHGWIDRLEKINAALDVPAVAETPAPAPLPSTLPECALVDERGRAFRLTDYAGQPLVITFIFTRCPFPNFCPLLNRRMEELQRALPADRPWHLFSISLDPEYDTPERLADYAKRFQRDPQRWTFVTGERMEIRRLGAAVGLAVAETAALPEHNLRTVVVDAKGRVQKVFAGNEWAAADLSTEMLRPPSEAPRN